MSLEHLGYNESIAQRFGPFTERGLLPARIVRQDQRYVVRSSTGEWEAEVSGRFRHEAASREAFPVIGDWVAIDVPQGAGRAVIHGVVERRGAFVRRAAGETTEAQVVAANIDVVFLVQGLDLDWNTRRLERYLVLAWESGAVPVIVLNKADACAELEERIAEAEALGSGVPVVAISALSSMGLDALAPWLLPGRTVALLGSSGVGKSTLVNALLGEERLRTGAVRDSDSRGRHTTTHKELITLPSGALLVDTPGMRELQLWGDVSGLDDSFADVAAFARACKFRDCRHESEPGCAVRAALRDGSLAAERFTSFRKLERELKFLEAQQNDRVRLVEKARWKQVTKANRVREKIEGGWKGLKR
jgi:ribosome biogenesis GTPase